MELRNLIACPDCGYEVSRLAEYCPSCGRPILQRLLALEILTAIMIGMFAAELMTKLFVHRIGN